MAYNTYATSPIRQKLNDKTVSGSIFAKFAADENLMRNLSKAVNRTWVYGTAPTGVAVDSNNCSHVADRLWLLGNGNVNNSGEYVYPSGSSDYLKDDQYDTSKFSGKFYPYDNYGVANASRVKYKVNSDGSTGSSAWNWWLRSANSNNDNNVGYVNSTGNVNNNRANNGNGVAPDLNFLI